NPLQINTLSGFYRTQLPSSISFDFKKLLLGETYTLKIFAVDSWDAKSEPIIKKITIPSGDINQQLLIPDIFNLNFEKNKAVNTASSNYSISEFGKINTVFDNYLKSFVYQLNSSTKDFSQFIINNNDEEKLTKQFTCDVIFKANEFSNIEQQIVSNNAAGGFAIIIPANSKKVAISAMIGGKKIMLESKDDIKLDKYYQATATFDGDEFVFYLNGEVQKRLTQSGVLTIPKANENFFVIGAKPAKSGAFTNYFSGMIYNFKLYSTALNKTHINEIINHNIFNNNFIIGDVNKDNKINTLDALFILKHCAKIITLDEEQIALADFSGDGKLNTLDALCILKKIVETNN
ncbi:MAG: LamG-like jellyroll fold domain-containing protein, partial [Clostridia bacterium]